MSRSQPPNSTKEDQPVPPDVLSFLWETYGSTLVDCHYDHDAISQVWEAFGSVLTNSCPLRLPEALAYPPSEDAAQQVDAVLTPGIAVGLMVFEIPWLQLDDAQRQSITDVPLTVVPMLEFLRAVVAWQEAQAEPHSNENRFDVRRTRLQLVVRSSGTGATSFDALGAHAINRMVTVHGTVIRLSSPKVVCRSMAFRCSLCGTRKSVDLEGGPLQYPTACNGKCRGFFQPITDSAVTEEVQLLKLQESTATASSGPGSSSDASRQARVVEVELRGMWMDIATAGDNLSISGVVSTRRGDKAAGGLRQLAIKALSLTTLGTPGGSSSKRSGAPSGALTGANYAFGKVAQFYELAKHPQWFDRLVNALCPGIMGHTEVKMAMLLSLVGGSAKTHVRSNIHLLLIGDPGLGKSQMLRAMAAVAPRSSMATANTSSSCGLTITLSRDPQNGETTFEAGAVVHGDGGITCIDEIDKGAAEHKALLEVMEQGTISIAKAGTLFSMPVDTSIVAAGNPVGGKFQPQKSLSENLNLSAPLLSRFDVIFLLKSHSNAASENITSHVLSMHRPRNAEASRGAQASAMLPPALITEFVQFVRDTCRPVMTTGAAVVLRDAYLEVRKQLAANNTQLPVTPRYLQSLVRLTEAKAKIELRGEVTADDAAFAVMLMRSGTKSYTEVTTPGASTSAGGGGSKKLSQRDMALANMERLMSSNGTEALSHDEAVSCCTDAGCKNPNAMLHQLNDFGALLMNGGRYRLRKKL